MEHPNKEHSDEVHPPPTHSVAAVQELPSDDYAEDVYHLSHMPPTATNLQEPHTSDEVNPLVLLDSGPDSETAMGKLQYFFSV